MTNPHPLITLLTDFGLQDEYVGVMKGVILSIQTGARIVDICHDTPPQNVPAAALMIEVAYGYFPAGSIHVLVIDPGVGTERRLIAVQAEGHTFLAPDNGLLTPILEKETMEDVRLIDRRDWYLPNVSNTFHGRDIFAPVAAHLAGGRPFWQIGPQIDPASCIRLKELHATHSKDGSIHGKILHVDRFGNLVTNITQEDIERLSAQQLGENLVIHIGGHQIEGLQRSYGFAPKESPLALIGSRGRLEIAICCENAAQKLGVALAEAVTIHRRKQD